MKKNASVLSIAYFTFVLLIIFSGSLAGIMSEAVYFLAYLLPFFAVILFTDGKIPKASEFSLSNDAKKLFLPTVFPTVSAIVVLSCVTSLLVSLLSGKSAAIDLGDSLLFALFYHALLPSILEELLFRYLPMRYLAPYSKKYAVLFSAVFFSVAHHSFFSIPYAFFAGTVFMAVNLACNSALPSIILHFINNSVSIIWLMYFKSGILSAVMIALLAVLTAVSLARIFLLRGRFRSAISEILSEKWEFCFTPTMFFTVFAALLAAFAELVM